MRDDLDKLLASLEVLAGTGAERRGYLANHGPMAAEALVALGQSAAAPDWTLRYRPILEPEPAERFRLDPADWPEHLGEIDRLGDWTGLFRRELGERPWPEVLRAWWPRLLPGLAASATHGVIRTAHGVRALALAGADPDPLLVDELAKGLGFWAARYQELPGSPALRGPDPLGMALTRLPRLTPDKIGLGGGISGDLAHLDELPGFAEGLAGYGAPADPAAVLDELISAAARVFLARPEAPIEFCHAVTAPAAVRLVLPHLPAEFAAPAVAASWQVVGGIVAAFSPDRLDGLDVVPAEPPAAEELVARAVASGDAHVIKLTEAAFREHARTGDAALLHAAYAMADRWP
ncbi:questin oxidase family protein [Crossiella sp. CA198]|uniref:questin oxidase family protein n=1 Tax=Crossiella sp. CA198 TaxID=3455607 RepID=UPI003F8D5A3E